MDTRLRYKGTGTVSIDGYGDVSHGETILVTAELAAVLVSEQPQNFELAEPAKKRAPARGGD